MRQRRQSKLEQYTDELDEWFEDEQVTLAQVRERLAERGCAVSTARLSDWRRNREWARHREQLLEQIAVAAQHCAEIEREFGQNPPPELETLIKLHRTIILELSSQQKERQKAISMVTALMRPVMEWARLEEKRRERELAEQKYRDEVEAQKAAAAAASTPGGLSPETLEKIERELKLM